MDDVKRMAEIMPNRMVLEKMEWSTIIDLENKLVTRVAYLSREYKTDSSRKDPDGLPLVLIGQERITRVRKMTDEEFLDYIKQYGMKMEIDMRVARDEKKAE